jgi:methyltransferase (TIGR00027 family)
LRRSQAGPPLPSPPAAQPTRRWTAPARSRFAEDSLALAVARGVRQAVALGAGLDTFALRNPFAARGLRVFEVDHPATQAWKRERLVAAGLAIPSTLTFVPVDLERSGLASALVGAGFELDRPAFFYWLGVVPYLPRASVTSTLRCIAGLPDSEVVFDYAEPPERYPEGRRAYLAERAARATAVGEPWITFLDPAEISAELGGLGFHEQEDLGLREIAARYMGRPSQAAESSPGPHIIRARQAEG